MKSTSYKIKIRATINGVEKVPSQIAWIQGNDSCLVTPCYKENDYLIVELIPECVGNACIEGYLIFDDTCSNCEPIHFKRCFCSTNADCDECEECNEFGICQSKCVEGEYCLNDTCVECDPNTPCPDGKVCINGRCVCPQGTFEKNGQCVECDETTILNKCQECIKGKIVEKPCDGNCDPLTGNCVDCLTSGDCFDREDGKNCCNPDTKQCECCPGTKWSAELLKCVPVFCTDDEDCGDPCLKCTEDGCKPIICPAGFKCWNGECVEWPCLETSCENGADCGDGCGCVEIDGVKQCVPCHVLECLGLCELALGCKCNEFNKCESVNNCGQYCDDDNPCTDPNCTCYNNECVSCENFPCNPDDCSTRTNCGCVDGDCEGDKGCKDTLKIKQECGEFSDSCKLIAEAVISSCKCDDIRFESQIINTVSPSDFSEIKIKTKLFKGLIEYNNFNHITIGDNEFVSGAINVKVSQYDNSNNLVNTNLTTLSKAITNNSVSEIVLKDAVHYNVRRSTSTGIKYNKIVIELIAQNIKIENNDCINYDNNTVIATYSFDFRVPDNSANPEEIYNSKVVFNNTLLNNYKVDIQKKYINDETSSKKPLFIWSKTSSDLVSSKYENNGDYNSKGWFRKQYGVKTSTGWADQISTPEQGLVNNYIYEVRVNCGCATKQVTDPIDFCCLPKVDPKFENCNTKVTIPSIKFCKVNGEIDDTNISAFNKPKYTWEITHDNGDIVYKNVVFNIDNITTQSLVYEDVTKPPITLVRLERRFTGGLLKNSDSCNLDVNPNAINLPEVVYNLTCNNENQFYNVVLNQVSTNPKILSATFSIDGGFTPLPVNISLGNNSQASTNIPYNLVGSARKVLMTVRFEGNCNKQYLITLCEPDIEVSAKPFDFSGKPFCEPTGPNIVVESFGFTNNVQFSLNNSQYQSGNTFSNLEPGTYIVNARDVIDGVEYIATKSIDIKSKMDVNVTLNPASLCGNQTSTLTIAGETGQTFTIQGPNGNILTNNATLVNNTFSLPGLTTPGNYRVTNNNTNEKYCNTDKTVNLSVGGEVLEPTLIYQAGDYCVGQPIPIRIFDGGKNKTYNISTSTGSLSTTQLQASNLFEAFYTPSSTSGSITINSATTSCDTMTPVVVPTNVTIVNGPIIGTPNSSCNGNLKTVSVNITGATNVTIGGVTITPVGTTYTATGITASTVDIVATNGSCTITENVILNNCDCPNYSAIIGISAETCGQGQQTIFVTGYTPGLIGYNYQLQKLVSGSWTNVSGQSGAFSTPTPEFIVNNQFNVYDNYRVVFTNDGCTFNSNVVETLAIQAPSTSIQGPTTAAIGETVTLSVQGGTPDSTYQWSGTTTDTGATTTIELSQSGTYTFNVAITTGPCVQNLTHTITVAPGVCQNPPNVSNITNTGLCDNPVANVTGVGALTVEWATDFISLDDPYTVIDTGTEFDGSLISLGDTVNLTAIVTDSNGCKDFSTVVYTRCQYDYFELSDAQTTPNLVGTCINNIQKVNTATRFRTSCKPPSAINIYIETIIDDGITPVIASTGTVTWNPPVSLSCGSNFARNETLNIDINTYGGQTLAITSRSYIGTDNTGILLGTANLGSVVIPATC